MRLAAAVVLVSASSVWAQAATTTVTILSRASRQGTIVSSSTTVPADVQAIQIDGDFHQADLTDPTKSCTIRVFVSNDDGATWVLAFRTGWQGGTHIDKWTGQEVPNTLSFAFGPIDHMAGWLVRGELDIPVTTRMGLNLTLNPPPRQ
jgi:hypothetical protein